MTNKMKKIFILTPLIILLCLFGVYFLFPGVMFDLLKTAERSAAGLKQHSVYVKGLRIEYLEGGKGDAVVLLQICQVPGKPVLPLTATIPFAFRLKR